MRHKIEDLVKPVEVPIPKIEDSEGVNTVGFVVHKYLFCCCFALLFVLKNIKRFYATKE